MLARRHLPRGFVVGVNIGRAGGQPMRRTPWRTISPATGWWPPSPTTWRSTSAARTRPACATFSRWTRSPTSSRGSTRPGPPAARDLRSSSSFAPDLEPAAFDPLVTALLDTPPRPDPRQHDPRANRPAERPALTGRSGRPIRPAAADRDARARRARTAARRRAPRHRGFGRHRLCRRNPGGARRRRRPRSAMDRARLSRAGPDRRGGARKRLSLGREGLRGERARLLRWDRI